MFLLIRKLAKGRSDKTILETWKIRDKLKYPLFLGRFHCFTMILGRVMDKFWSNKIINTINWHVHGNYPTHLSVGVPLKNAIKIKWLLKEQMIWWCSGSWEVSREGLKNINFFTIWLFWYERNVVSVLQDKDLLGHYF